MNMKEHILAALTELFNRWDELLASMDDEQITTLPVLGDWSTQDVIAHLWAWQQISIARMEAALQNREPEFPVWVEKLPENWEANANQVNAWVYETFHTKPWTEIHQNWRNGFLRFLELGNGISEINLLDSGKYHWLEGRPLAFILLASYDHHQEHLDKLQDWLDEHGID